jgi:hypothetical protein
MERILYSTFTEILGILFLRNILLPLPSLRKYRQTLYGNRVGGSVWGKPLLLLYSPANFLYWHFDDVCLVSEHSALHAQPLLQL